MMFVDAVELDGANDRSRLEFKSQPAELKLESTDTVPTKALRFPAGRFPPQWSQKDKDIEILWKEQLRS